jgi:peptidoglycan/xylan/chitin deacetylase (PgdA/CDA1 family)/GT2 family glycosyltransferase
VRILCLHYLARPGEARPRRLALARDGLLAMVDRERRDGRKAGTCAEAALDLARFALTFDDAHASLLGVGLPLLRELDVPGAVFVPTDYVGTSDEFLGWDDLRRLRDAGWTIGSHGRRHTRASWRLYDEDDAAQQHRLDDEMASSRAILETKLGITVVDFAYPYGEVTPAAREAAARAGYVRAFTVRPTLDWDGDALAIPRLDALEAHGLVRPRRTQPTPISVVIPACDRHEMLREVVATWSAQTYPADAFEVIVVDDGSRSPLGPALEGAAPAVRLVSGGGDPGMFRAGMARQRGAEQARFEILAFLDADIAVGRDFLWHLDWVHQRVENAAVLGYLSGYNLHDIGFVHGTEDLERAGGPDGLPILPDRSREPALRRCLDNLDWLSEPWRLAYTGNLSVPRRLFEQVGGFASEFSGWGLEDLDLGYRLHKAGAAFVFSRFAVGHHLVDPSEGSPRNPFRATGSPPTRDRFAGYQRNIATLAALHPDDTAIARFVAQARADIEETCGRPGTVGVEFGGACSLECALHRRLHKCQPGGVDEHELYDRLAYATKVGARALYLLGGDPAQHPAFLRFLRAARTANIQRITSETTAIPFAEDGFARAARLAGLDEALIEVLAFDEEGFDALTRTSRQHPRFLAGLDSLAEAGIRLAARLVVEKGRMASVPASFAALRTRGIELREVVAPEELFDPLRAAGCSEALLRPLRS